ncbi:SDR family oxidoreductase [Streptantibioticus ferralitis]|uniref:SDR family oxidoreductase n=1 Tax=Streptantibioticus ferralitis TaxID=236510 RepID=A0ABT5Z2C7_9ACTN|nr:SDR family oxidoreductase [Streptantibioticus ferralitis]MDF2257731.1 SDR family oxidoreductase [Streptantibioticus ferralitis]
MDAQSQPIFSRQALAGEVALVTGGSSGLGLAIAEKFATHGCQVLIAARSEERLKAASSLVAQRTGRPCATFGCDVRDPSAVDSARERLLDLFGKLTIVVNNAAANFRMAADRMTLRAFSTVVDIDLTGTFNVTRACVGELKAAGGGSILNITVPDPERGFPQYSHAGAAKAGILSLTRSWAREWGEYGIRVNSLGPGPVPTEGVARNMLGMSDGSMAFRDFTDEVPLRRLGTPKDVADAALFLSSRAASWITGVHLHVDGGFSLP